MCAEKSHHTYPRPYAYLNDLRSVWWRVTRSVAMARQAWRAIGEGQQQQKPFWKKSEAASKSCTFCSPGLPPIHLFVSFLILRTPWQATAICMMWSASAFFFAFLECLRVAVCRRLGLRVLMCRDRLPESACCRRRSKKTNDNWENMHKSAAFKGRRLVGRLNSAWSLAAARQRSLLFYKDFTLDS